MFAGKGLNSDIRELRGHPIQPLFFDENDEP
jgi:hypothetical protein